MATNPTNLLPGGDFQTDGRTAIAITDAADTVVAMLTMPRDMDRLYFEVKNSGGNPFDQFEIQRRANPSATWETLASVAGDYTSPKLPILEVNTVGIASSPVTLGAGENAFIRMELGATESVRFLASGSGATTSEIYYRMDK